MNNKNSKYLKYSENLITKDLNICKIDKVLEKIEIINLK